MLTNEQINCTQKALDKLVSFSATTGIQASVLTRDLQPTDKKCIQDGFAILREYDLIDTDHNITRGLLITKKPNLIKAQSLGFQNYVNQLDKKEQSELNINALVEQYYQKSLTKLDKELSEKTQAIQTKLQTSQIELIGQQKIYFKAALIISAASAIISLLANMDKIKELIDKIIAKFL